MITIKIPKAAVSILSLVFLLFFSSVAYTQETSLTFRNSTLASSASSLPFWLHAGQNGKFAESSQFLNLSELQFHTTGNIGNSQWKYLAATNLIAGLADENYFRANQLFAGIQYNRFILKAGWFSNEIHYNGLSSTNGDIHWSNNIRPLPRIRLQTDDFITFSFFPHWFSIKSLYEEGFLNDDNRYVQNAHLHHKNVYLGFQLNPSTFLALGLDHYAQWDGTHPELGSLPGGFNNYYPVYIWTSQVQRNSSDGDQRICIRQSTRKIHCHAK